MQAMYELSCCCNEYYKGHQKVHAKRKATFVEI